MSDAAELNKAIRAHSMWKVRLQDAVETGRSDITPQTIGNCRECEFGKWFYSLPATERASEEWKKVEPLHAGFHSSAAKVLEMALNGRRDDARFSLTDIKGEFMWSSAQLTNALAAWKGKLS